MKKFNVGIIGYGWVATAHIPAINATALGQVTAVCSSRKLDSAELSLKYGGRVTAYTDFDEMLANPDIHVISIVTVALADVRFRLLLRTQTSRQVR